MKQTRPLMKTMSCKQLGGACNMKFHAKTFEIISEMSQKHGEDMFEQKDERHIAAMQELKKITDTPEKIETWLALKRKEFDDLPDDE